MSNLVLIHTPAQPKDELHDEIDEILHSAFVGLFARDENGNFVSLDDKYGVLKDSLKEDILDLLDKWNRKWKI